MKKILFTLIVLFLCVSGWAQYPLVTFQDIQEVSEMDLSMDNDGSYLSGDTVQVQGIVTFDPCYYGLSSSGSRMGTFLQTADGSPWGGLHVLIDAPAIGYPGDLEELNNATLFIDNFQVGNEVKVTGIVSEFSGFTQLQVIPLESEIVGFGTLPDPIVMTIDSFMVSDGGGGQILQRIPGEQYEGIYVEFQNVFVVNVTPSGDRWFWDVQDTEGNAIAIRDLSGFFRNDGYDDECPLWLEGMSGTSATPDAFAPPALGSNLEFIRGVIQEYNGEYYITPLTPDDLGPSTVSPPVVLNLMNSPSVPSSSEIVTISADITDTDGTITSATLNYSIGLGNTTYTSVAMINTAADSWEAQVIPTGTDSTYVNFWVQATDNDGNVTNSPDDMATGSFYLVYDDGINSISRIQKTFFSGGGSIWAGSEVLLDITATVTATVKTYDLGLLTIQDDTAPWSGIFVQSVAGDGTDALFRGDEIHVTSATVIEQFGVTYLTDIEFELNSSLNLLPDFETTLLPDSVDAGIFEWTEPYEAMLVRFNDVFITSENADDPSNFGEFAFNTSDTPDTGLRVDDFSFAVPYEFGVDSVDVGDELAFIQGPLYFSFGNWKLIPRDLNDIAGFSTDYPNNIVSFSFNGLTPAVNASIDQNTFAITATVPAGTDLSALVPSIEHTGQLLAPASGEVQDFTAPVVYTCVAPSDGDENVYTVVVDRAVGIEDVELVNDLNIFPNPSKGLVNVSFNVANAGDFSISIYDVRGQLQMQNAQYFGNGTQQVKLDMGELSDGLYILELSSNGKSVSRQLNILK